MLEFHILGSNFSPFLPSYLSFYSLGNLISKFNTSLLEASCGSIPSETTSPRPPISPSYLFLTLLLALIFNTIDMVRLLKPTTDHSTLLFKIPPLPAYVYRENKIPVKMSRPLSAHYSFDPQSDLCFFCPMT